MCRLSSWSRAYKTSTRAKHVVFPILSKTDPIEICLCVLAVQENISKRIMCRLLEPRLQNKLEQPHAVVPVPLKTQTHRTMPLLSRRPTKLCEGDHMPPALAKTTKCSSNIACRLPSLSKIHQYLKNVSAFSSSKKASYLRNVLAILAEQQTRLIHIQFQRYSGPLKDIHKHPMSVCSLRPTKLLGHSLCRPTLQDTNRRLLHYYLWPFQRLSKVATADCHVRCCSSRNSLPNVLPHRLSRTHEYQHHVLLASEGFLEEWHVLELLGRKSPVHSRYVSHLPARLQKGYQCAVWLLRRPSKIIDPQTPYFSFPVTRKKNLDGSYYYVPPSPNRARPAE